MRIETSNGNKLVTGKLSVLIFLRLSKQIGMCYITELSLGKLNIINSEKYNFEEELKAKSNY